MGFEQTKTVIPPAKTRLPETKNSAKNYGYSKTCVQNYNYQVYGLLKKKLAEKKFVRSTTTCAMQQPLALCINSTHEQNFNIFESILKRVHPNISYEA